MTHSSIIAIGASAGGVEALRALVADMPKALSAPILIVLHIGAHRSEMPKLLAAAGPLPAKHGDDGEPIYPGHIYIAPPDRHMIVAKRRLRLLRTPKENWARPAIDPLFRSVAEDYGPQAVGVILTGNLNDGSLGLAEIKRRGGIAVAQSLDDAAYPEMPGSAAAHVALDYCVPIDDMAKLLVNLVDGKHLKEAVMPITPSQSVSEQEAEVNAERQFERPVAITCPDCGGALNASEEGTIIKFGCHIGHTYTADIMAPAHFDKMERVLRSAVRFLNERAAFCLQMAEHTRFTSPETSTAWQAASKQAQDRAYKLRDLVEQDWITPEPSFAVRQGSKRA